MNEMRLNLREDYESKERSCFLVFKNGELSLEYINKNLGIYENYALGCILGERNNNEIKEIYDFLAKILKAPPIDLPLMKFFIDLINATNEAYYWDSYQNRHLTLFFERIKKYYEKVKKNNK